MYGKYMLFYESLKTGDITWMRKQCVTGLSLDGRGLGMRIDLGLQWASLDDACVAADPGFPYFQIFSVSQLWDQIRNEKPECDANACDWQWVWRDLKSDGEWANHAGSMLQMFSWQRYRCECCHNFSIRNLPVVQRVIKLLPEIN